MSQGKNMSRFAVVAGLGLSMALGTFAPAFAEAGLSDTPVVGDYANPSYNSQVSGSSTGETKLYIRGVQDDLTVLEGANNEQLKVSIPVAIHYVADGEGNLVGPSDDTVKFVNHTKLGPVHVSKICVLNSENVSIVKNSLVKANDEMSFYMQPMQGQSDKTGTSFTRGTATEGDVEHYPSEGHMDELGTYSASNVGLSPTFRNDWNIAQKDGALALNSLTGKIGGFGKISPATDYQAGTVRWTVRAGTRALADKRDASIVVHYHPNQGSYKNGTPISDQWIQVLDIDSLPEKKVKEGTSTTALLEGASLLDPPASITNADGTTTSYQFAGWNTQADGKGDTVTTIGQLGTLDTLAGGDVEVYATYKVSN